MGRWPHASPRADRRLRSSARSPTGGGGSRSRRTVVPQGPPFLCRGLVCEKPECSRHSTLTGSGGPAPSSHQIGRVGETILTVTRIVDPSPIIEERLREVAAQYEPRLSELRASIASESARSARRRLKRSLRQTKRDYRRARAEVEVLRIACW